MFMIYPAVFIILVFIVVIIMITFNITDHTIVALIYFAQIWEPWRLSQIQIYIDLANNFPVNSPEWTHFFE